MRVVYSSDGANQRRSASRSVQALNTRSRRAAKVRFSRRVASDAGGLSVMLPPSCSLLGTLVFLEVGGQRVEPPPPEPPVAGDPGDGLLERRRLEAAAALASLSLAGDEPGALEDSQVPRDRRQGDLERPRELSHRGLTRGEPGQDRPARRIGQGRESRIEGGGRMLNHAVNYMEAASGCQEALLVGDTRYRARPRLHRGARRSPRACSSGRTGRARPRARPTAFCPFRRRNSSGPSPVRWSPSRW